MSIPIFLGLLSLKAMPGGKYTHGDFRLLLAMLKQYLKSQFYCQSEVGNKERTVMLKYSKLLILAVILAISTGVLNQNEAQAQIGPLGFITNATLGVIGSVPMQDGTQYTFRADCSSSATDAALLVRHSHTCYLIAGTSTLNLAFYQDVVPPVPGGIDSFATGSIFIEEEDCLFVKAQIFADVKWDLGTSQISDFDSDSSGGNFCG